MTDYTPDELRLLAGKEFAEILRSDPEMRKIQARKSNSALEFFALASFFRWPCLLGSCPVRPVTPAIWALLSAIRSPYTIDNAEVSDLDSDIVLYLLARGTGELPIIPEELPVLASGFCRTAGLAPDEAEREIRTMIAVAFRPLSNLPPAPSGGSARYGVVWLASIVGIAARESNMRAEEVMHKMSLTSVCAYYVAARKREDYRNEIHERCDGDTVDAIDARMDELAAEFLNQKNKVTECLRSVR